MEQPFIHIVDEHQAIIHKVCRIYRDTPEDREDLFQEIVYQLWKAFPSFQARSSVGTWMYRVALSTAVARYRKKTNPTVPLDNTEAMAVSSEEVHPKQDLLYRAIAALNDAEKAVITLYLDDYSNQEMADVLGISANHIGVKLHRIKEKLIHQLNPKNHGTR